MLVALIVFWADDNHCDCGDSVTRLLSLPTISASAVANSVSLSTIYFCAVESSVSPATLSASTAMHLVSAAKFVCPILVVLALPVELHQT